jgi:hypothetical protein
MDRKRVLLKLLTQELIAEDRRDARRDAGHLGCKQPHPASTLRTRLMDAIFRGEWTR